MDLVVRVTIIYLFLLIGLRILGKRELGQLSPFELVTLMLIPEIVERSIVGDDHSLTGAIVAVSTLFCLVFVNTLLSYRSARFRELSEGTPVVLVSGGRLLTEHMHRERVPADEIFSEMHKSGLERLEEVRWAILEPDGKISIVPMTPESRHPHPDDRREIT